MQKLPDGQNGCRCYRCFIHLAAKRVVVPVVELGVELGVADKSAYMEPALQAILQG
ncbi:hypothetical protein [Pseudophaeobacter arcticus]|uniref:hypothetical protein n=1 Tax=Pseudophaeobacter arcticus TaxID=385492 RepID=UPI00248F8113|nr:hypothetical protein [Pseudophaeobacter arcticus]